MREANGGDVWLDEVALLRFSVDVYVRVCGGGYGGVLWERASGGSVS